MGLFRLFWIPRRLVGQARHLRPLPARRPARHPGARERAGRRLRRRRGPRHGGAVDARRAARRATSCRTGCCGSRTRRRASYPTAGAGRGDDPRPADDRRPLDRVRPRRAAATAACGRTRSRPPSCATGCATGRAWPRTRRSTRSCSGCTSCWPRRRRMLVTATLDDALGVEERPNYPGTTDERNWSVALPVPIEELETDPRAAASPRRSRDARKARHGHGPARAAAGVADAGEGGQGAARRRHVGVRAEVGRVPLHRVPQRRRGAPRLAATSGR